MIEETADSARYINQHSLEVYFSTMINSKNTQLKDVCIHAKFSHKTLAHTSLNKRKDIIWIQLRPKVSGLQSDRTHLALHTQSRHIFFDS
jgi:hypothetical protein